MERTVKLKAKVDPATYKALKEVEREYREILLDAVEYGLTHGITSFTRIRAGIYWAEREKHRGLPSHYIYTACEDASMRLKSFRKLKKQGKAHTDKPEVKNVTVHLDDHLWKFTLSEIRISTKQGWVSIRPTLHKLFWKYYNGGWRMAGEARFKLLKGNVVEFYITFKRDPLTPYKPQGLIPVDLNEDNVAVLVDGQPLLLETNTKKITLGYEYRRRSIMNGGSTKTRRVRKKLTKLREKFKKLDMQRKPAVVNGNSTKVRRVKKRLARLRERFKKLDIRRKLAVLIVRAARERRSAIVLEDLPDRAPERMIEDTKDPQLRLRIYRAAFSSIKRAIIEKAEEYGVPVILVNPAYTSTVCPIHGSPIDYRPDGGNAPRVGKCRVGGELWHRDVVALYNLLKKAGDGSPVPLGSTGPHDPPTVKPGGWLRAKTLPLLVGGSSGRPRCSNGSPIN